MKEVVVFVCKFLLDFKRKIAMLTKVTKTKKEIATAKVVHML